MLAGKVYDGGSMNAAALQAVANNPFVTTALPIMFTVLLAVWMNNKGFDGVHKRLDDMGRRFDTVHTRIDEMRADFNRRFDKIDERLERIEEKLDDHGSRIARLEERTSPLTRR